MNLNEVKKYVTIQIILYILIGLCFIVSMIAILVTPVKAKTQSTDLNSSIFADCGGSRSYNKYCDYNASRSPQYVARSLNTTISGITYQISFGFQRQMSAYSQYILNVYAMSTDFRNNDLSVVVYGSNLENSINNVMNNVTYSFISKNQIQIVIPENSYTYHYIVISGDSLTGVNSYGVKNITLSWDDGSTDMSGVINNQTQNTQNIINNANENTNQIITTQNEIYNNTLQTQRSQLENLCSNSYSVSLTKGGLISGTNVVDSATGFYSDYINVNLRGNTITRVCLQNTYQGNTPSQYLIFYDSNKNVLQTNYANNACRNLPSGTAYFRIGTNYPGALLTAGDYCVKAENQIYDYLKDDSNPSVNQSGIDDVLSEVEVSDPLNYLLTLPISLLQKLNTVLSANSCSRVSFGSLYNTELYLPCINFEQILGSSIWGTIDLIVGVGLLAIILKKFYDSISNILTLGKEKEVRDKLDLPTPMQFLAHILGGGKE